MRTAGVVSLWLGKADSEGTLLSALELAYSPDGDLLGCAFSDGFRLKPYDDDFREAAFRDAWVQDLAGHLSGVSYETSVTSGFATIGVKPEPGENCFVLLYDYLFTGNPIERWTVRGLSLRFAGTVSYEK